MDEIFLFFIYRGQEKFRRTLARTGGFLWNYISIPGPIIKESEILPYVARKRQRGKPNPLHYGLGRGRPSKEYVRKQLRAKQYARTKLKEAANQDADLVIDTARVMAKDVDKDVSYVMKQMAKDPSLAAWLKDQIKKKKKGG